VRFLLDQNLARLVADELSAAGHDAVHVRAYGMQRADDRAILHRARSEGRVLVSADTDFGELLVREAAASPSVVLFRPSRGRGQTPLHTLILDNVDTLRDAAAAGSIIVLSRDRIRIRSLPIVPTPPT
jgi:predicted nuclease of predicted toxin-antitoxin system